MEKVYKCFGLILKKQKNINLAMKIITELKVLQINKFMKTSEYTNKIIFKFIHRKLIALSDN